MSDIDFSQCSSLATVDIACENFISKLSSYLDGLGKCLNLTNLNITRLYKEVELSFSSFENCKKLSTLKVITEDKGRENINLTGLGCLSGLKTVSIIGVGNFMNLKGFENMKMLSLLEVSNCSLNNIDSISNLTELNYLNFANNQIASLNALKNLKKVTELNLTNNAILDDSSYLDENQDLVKYKNMDIIAGLNSNKGGALKKIYLAGNNISDYSTISNLAWEDWSGFGGK